MKSYGNLFKARQKTNPKAPDATGFLEVQAETIRFLADQMKAGNTETDRQGNAFVKVDISAWENVSKNGLKYLRLMVSPPQERSAGRPSSDQETMGQAAAEESPWEF